MYVHVHITQHWAHLWYKNQNAGLSGIDYRSYGVDACPIVVATEEAMLYKFVVLDIFLHALFGHKMVDFLVYLTGLRRTRCV